MRRLIPFLTLPVLWLCAASASAAEGSDSEFVIRLRGFAVGAMHLSIQQDEVSYGVEAQVKDAGLLSVFRSFSYRGTSRGALRDARPEPAYFEDATDTGRRQSQAVLDYAGSVPRVTHYASSTPPGPDTPAPATQGDTIDPTTALYMMFRDQPEGTACNRTILMYDGMRRSHVVLNKPRRDGDVLRCAGEYRRLQGFTAKDLARNVAFGLEMTLKAAGNGMVHVTHVEISSSYGLVTLDRR